MWIVVEKNICTGSPPITRFSNNTVYFGTLICPFRTKLPFHLHGCFSKVSKNSVSRGLPVFILDLFYLLRVAKVCHDSLIALQSAPLRETTECFDVCFQIPAK